MTDDKKQYFLKPFQSLDTAKVPNHYKIGVKFNDLNFNYFPIILQSEFSESLNLFFRITVIKETQAK